MYRFEGVLKAQSPITVFYPDTYGLPRTMHGEAMLHAGTFRGPLRKAALRVTRRLIAEGKGISENEVMTLRDAYMNGQGIDTSRQVNNELADKKDPVGRASLRTQNLFLSTFGRWGLSGRLAVSELRTDAKNVMVVGQGARADMFDRDPDEIQYLTIVDQQLLLSQLESKRKTQLEIDALTAEQWQLRKQARQAEVEQRRKLREQVNVLDRQIKQIKDSREGSAESIQRPLSGYEAIAPGSELSHRITLLDHDAFGLIVTALCEMMQEPFIGGHRNHGCGEVSGVYDVKYWARGELAPQAIGRLVFGAEDGVRLEGDYIQRAYERFKAEAINIDLSVLTLADASK